jgi:hypothetical protein
MGANAMTGEQREINIKDVIICGAFFWAYQEYAKSQRLGDTYISTPLDEIADGLWKRLKQSEKAPPMPEEHKKIFQFLFEKEFKTWYSLIEDERDDMLEQIERFFKKIGYEPEIKITRE